MARSLSLPTFMALVAWLGSSETSADPPRVEPVEAGILPTDARGRPLNLDFEAGTLADWTAKGQASEIGFLHNTGQCGCLGPIRDRPRKEKRPGADSPGRGSR